MNVMMVLAAALPVLTQGVRDGRPSVEFYGKAYEAKEVKNVTVAKDPLGGMTAYRIGKGGVIRFPLEGRTLEKGGTVAMWFRPDWLPKATGSWAIDSATDSNGVYRADVASAGRLQLFSVDAKKDACVQVCGGGLNLPGAPELKTLKNVFPGTWSFAAVSWNGQRKDVVAVTDGAARPPQHGWGGKVLFEIREAVFGRGLAWQPGFEGDVAFLKVWDRVLTADELRQEYAKVQPMAVELEDYAVTAGEKSRLRFKLFNLSGKTVRRDFRIRIGEEEQSEPVTVEPGGMARVAFGVTVAKPGVARLVTSENRAFEICAVDGGTSVTKAMKPGEVKWNLLETFDATKDHPREKMLAEGTTVVRDPSGDYRENSQEIRSAWCWRPERLRHPHRWHVLEVEYPDNACRTFAVHLYAVNPRINAIMGGQMESIGIATGAFHFNTYRTQRRRLLFRPDVADTEVIVETGPFSWAFCRGAATSVFRIYEADCETLPSLGDLPGDREIGVWDEDPTMDCEWFNRAHFTSGQDLDFWRVKAERIVEYARYMGHNRWTVQLVDYDGDRNGSVLSLPSSTTRCAHGHVDGWCDVYAKVFAREGLPWYGRLGISYQGGRFYEGLLGADAAARLVQRKASGKDVPPRRADSTEGQLDPALPGSTEAWRRIVAHYRAKYADNPAFRGLSVDAAKCFRYGGREFGYGDETVALFEKETGIKVGVPADRRYAHLMCGDKALRKAWCDWRCRKVVAHVKGIADELRKGNGRLVLKGYLSIYALYAGNREKGFDQDEHLRELGVDIAAINALEGVELVPYCSPDEDTIFGYRPEGGDYDRTIHDPETFAYLNARLKKPALNFIIHSNLECYPGVVAHLPECHFPLNYYAFGEKQKKNCDFLSWASCFPNEDEVMQPYCAALAYGDLQEFDLGFWGMPEMGMQERFRRFYRAFRSIPKGRYELVNDPKDPVAVRANGENWYMVNKESFEVKVRAATVGGGLRTPREWTLGPCEVVVKKGGRPTAFEQTYDESVLAPFRKANFAFKEADLAIKGGFSAALEASDFAAMRRTMCCNEGFEALKAMKAFSCEARWRAGDRTIEVKVKSFVEGSQEVRVSMETGSGVWAPDPKRVRTLWIKEGETKVVLLHPARYPTKDGEKGLITLVLDAPSAKRRERFDFLLGGAFAYYDAEKSGVGEDWTFSRYRMRKAHQQSKDPNHLDLGFDYAIGYLWNESGLYVAVDVEETDENVLLPKDGGSWNESPTRSDSLQYFFSCAAGVPYDTNGRLPNDIECLIYYFDNGKRGTYAGINHRADWADFGEPFKWERHHVDGRTKYEFHLPAGQMPGVRMEPNTVIAACALINNKWPNRGLWHRFLTSCDVFPWRRPGTWPSLTFVKEN